MVKIDKSSQMKNIFGVKFYSPSVLNKRKSHKNLAIDSFCGFNYGFTLIEIIAIIILLSAIALLTYPIISNLIGESKEDLYNKQISELERISVTWATQNIDKLKMEDGYSYNLSFEELYNQGLITEKDIKNPKTGENLEGCIQLSYNSNNENYDVNYELTCTTLGEIKNPVINLTVNQGIINSSGYATEDFDVNVIGNNITSYTYCVSTNECEPTTRVESSRGTIAINTDGINYVCVIGSDGSKSTDKLCKNYKLDKSGVVAGTLVINGTKGNNDWYVSDVSFSVIDAEGMSSTLNINKITSDTAGTNVIVTTTNIETGAIKTETYTIKVDKTAPIAGTLIVNGTKGLNDWYTSNVTFTVVNGSDATSGHATTTSNISSITSNTNGTIVTVTTKDNAGNTSTRDYTIKVNKDKPTEGTLVINGTKGNNGWYVSDVSLSVIDAEGVTSSLNITSITEDTTGTDVIVTSTDNITGTVTTKTYTIKVDKTPPTAGTLTINGTKGTGDWYLSDVTLTVNNGSDTTSGHVSTVSSHTSVTGNTNGTIVTVTTTDGAGNTSTRDYTIKINKNKPTEGTLVIDGTKGLDDWYISDVNLSVIDAEGVTSSLNINKITSDTTGTDVIVTSTNTETGAVTTKTHTIKVDKTKPTAGTLNIIGTKGNNDWYTSDVTLTVNNGSDTTSGHLSTTSNISSITSDTTGTKVVVTTMDKAGNTSTRDYTIKVDKTKPTLTAKTGTFEIKKGDSVDSKTYFNDPTYGISGEASYTCNVTNTSTLEAGTQTINCTATSNNGLSTTASVNITVFEPVALVDNTDYYATLVEAVNSANNSGTLTDIKLLKNTTENVTFTKGKNVNLNLNGYTVNGYMAVNADAILELQNGTVTNNYSGVSTLNNHGTLKLTSGTITSTDGNAINNYGILNVLGSINISNISTSSSVGYPTIYNDSTGTANISAGNISSVDEIVITNSGTLNIEDNANISSTGQYPTIYNNSTGIVYAKGGNITSTASNTINNYGTLNVSGSTINSSSATYPAIANGSSATTNITGGNVTADHSNAVRNLGILNIKDSAELSNSGDSYPTIYNDSTGTVNILAGTITANVGVAIANEESGTVYIKGGTITATDKNAVANSGTLSIEGTASISNSSTSPVIYNEDTGIMDISGGTITATYTNAIRNLGTLDIKDSANISNSGVSTPTIVNGSTGTMNILGGTITGTNVIAITNLENGTIYIKGGTIKAINADAISNSGTVTIQDTANISNNSSSSPTLYNEGTGIMNILGGTITATNSVTLVNLENGTVYIKGGTIKATSSNAIANLGTLTIQDTASISNDSSTSPVISNQSTGTMNILGGTITATDANAIRNGGTLTIEGTAKMSNNSSTGPAIANDSLGTINILGGTITANNGLGISNSENGIMYIKGGTITSTNSNAIKNEGTLTIQDSANISGGDDSSPTIYNDSTGTANILGGTITASNGMAIANMENGTMYIKGGTITATGSNAILNMGTLNIEGTANISNSGDSTPTITNGGTGTLNILGGTITGNDVITIYNLENGNVYIKGGNIISNDANAINNLGSLTIEGTANITNNNASSPTVYNQSTGIMYIKGGTITAGATNAIINFGTLNVQGTANITNNSSSTPTVYNQSTGTFTMSSGTIKNSNSSGYGVYNNGGSATYTGGTISSKNF